MCDIFVASKGYLQVRTGSQSGAGTLVSRTQVDKKCALAAKSSLSSTGGARNASVNIKRSVGAIYLRRSWRPIRSLPFQDASVDVFCQRLDLSAEVGDLLGEFGVLRESLFCVGVVVVCLFLLERGLPVLADHHEC